jgi:hypothetical protein
VSLADWVTNTKTRLSEEGIGGLRESGYMLYTGLWRIVGSRLPLGTNVYEADWDVLVVLDGCRVDSLRRATSERSKYGTVDSRVSLGSTSREWLAKTFTPAYESEISETAYVTANPYTSEILSASGGETRSPFNPANWGVVDAETFGRLEELWRDHWDDELGTVPPGVMTDRAISVARSENPERLIVHYMQPHQPFIGDRSRERGQTWREDSCWHALRRGETTARAVRAAFEENVELVLEDVDLLVENVTGRVVVSADHGNAFGEWFVYGHPNGFLHPAVKTVPWAEVRATDGGTHEPPPTVSEPEADRDVSVDIEDQLKDLGYL